MRVTGIVFKRTRVDELLRSSDIVTRRDFLRRAGTSALATGLLGAASGTLATPAFAQSPSGLKPSILFVLMDNLGYGEPGVYGGGVLRGAATPRIDKLATEGRASRISMLKLSARRADRRS